MKYLGIDYGRRKIGLAVSDGKLAEPLKVIRYTDIKLLEKQVKQIIKEYEIEKVIVGMSENEMAEEINRFVETIRYTLNPIPCETSDETLSSHDAQQMSIASGMGRKKRKEMEDAFAATIMLQNYLDTHDAIK